MKKRIFCTIWISGFILLLNGTAAAKVQDSIGTKVRNGKVYIVHEVDKGQGIFTVAKRYGLSMDQVIKENPGSDKGLIMGQLLFIPTGKQAPFEEPVVKEYFSNDNKKPGITEDKKPEEKTTFATYHTVEAGETLFAISKKYNTSPAVIRDLNGLSDNDVLSLGQKLLVPNVKSEEKNVEESAKENDEKAEKALAKIEHEKKEEAARLEKEAKKEAKKEEKKAEKKEKPIVESKGQSEDIAEIKKKYSAEKETVEPGKTVVAEGNYEKKVENLPEFDVEKVTEKGNALLLKEDGVNQSRNVAYHYEASENTIIMVTNPLNNKAVFVKVVGKSDLDSNKGNIIYLSKAAFDQIGLKDNGGSVEVSYAR